MNENKKGVNLIPVVAVIMLVIVSVFVVTLFRDAGKSNSTVNTEEAYAQLTSKLRKIDVTEGNISPLQLDAGEFLDTASELPDIDSSYPVVVTGNGTANVEIFSSGEKAAKSGTDSFLSQMAQEFNGQHQLTSTGHSMSVIIRSVPSGTAVEYISSGKHVPDAYTPSNELFGEMLAQSTDISVVTDRLVGNAAGILVNKVKYDQLVADYGEVNVETVVQAVIDGKLMMGYPNPYTSASGINFLMTFLQQADADDLFSDTAIEMFQSFQANVPVVSLTTQQLTNSAEKGVVDALVMEYQTYQNDAALSRSYEFVPFGVRHDNPLYAIGNLSADKMETLNAFVAYCAEHQAEATKDGFNGMDSFTGIDATFTGNDIGKAQTIWKEQKNGGVPVVAEFIVDTSGSMRGEPLNNLQKAMLNCIPYINDNNYIGVISFDSDVCEVLPIGQFDLNQKTLYKGAVASLDANGNTAMYDALAVGLDRVHKKVEELGGNATPIIFVLTDGQSNTGLSHSALKPIVEGMQVPIYTVSYNYESSTLTELANICEAAAISGDSDDITYKLRNLFNSEM